jgi:hypothetical protein
MHALGLLQPVTNVRWDSEIQLLVGIVRSGSINLITDESDHV